MLISTIYLSKLEYFETIVFDGEATDRVMLREDYDTEKMARERHQEIVDDIKQNPKRYQI